MILHELMIMMVHRLVGFFSKLMTIAISNLWDLFKESFFQLLQSLLCNVTEYVLCARPIPLSIPGYQTAKNNRPNLKWIFISRISHRILFFIDDIHHFCGFVIFGCQDSIVCCVPFAPAS